MLDGAASLVLADYAQLIAEWEFVYVSSACTGFRVELIGIEEGIPDGVYVIGVNFRVDWPVLQIYECVEE